MPLADCGFKDGGGHPGWLVLEARGPTLFVDVGFDPAYDHADPKGAPVAAAKQVPALVDTGAIQSCIDDDLAKELGLPIIDRQEISGVGGKHEVPVYLAQIHVPVLGYTQYGKFAGVALKRGGQQHQALIGRSFLRAFIMIYDGLRGQVTLAI